MPNFVGHILSSADECSFLVVELHWCVLASCTPKSWSFDNHLCVKLLNLSFWEITHVQTKTYHIVLPMKLTCPQNSFCGNIPLILFPSYSHPSFINLETSSIYSFFFVPRKKTKYELRKMCCPGPRWILQLSRVIPVTPWWTNITMKNHHF